MKVLLLAGTAEARQLADLLLAAPDVELTASLAGRTSAPMPYPCAMRTGGFGGVGGLVAYLREHRVGVVVDATHPFSRVMPGNARAAADLVGVPHLRLVRPPWIASPQDRWVDARDLRHAAQLVDEPPGRTVLLTVGRLELGAFMAAKATFIVRTIDPPDPLPLPGATVLLDRGPFDVQSEMALLEAHGVDLLVTKNSGGDPGKLRAARALGLPVVMVRRPLVPADEGTVASAHQAAEHLRALAAASGRHGGRA